MKALGFHEHGGVDQLEVLEMDRPTPDEGEALVRVEAAAMNRLDLFVLGGIPGIDLEMPHVGGADMAGVVEETGPGVTDLEEGDRVVLYPSMSCGDCRFCARGEVPMCRQHHLTGEHTRGTFREYATFEAGRLLKVPDHVDIDPSGLAAAPLTFLTAWRMLVTRGRIEVGEDVLVVGSGGGVNIASLQIAERAGCDVTVVAGGAEKAKRAEGLGADATVDYTEDGDWHKTLLSHRDGRGFDVVVDNVGETTWQRSLKAAARGGRVLVVGGTTGYNPPAGINYLFWKQIDVRGSTMGTPQEFEDVMDQVFHGDLTPVVDRVVPLEEGARAYEAMEAGDHFGKIVLRP